MPTVYVLGAGASIGAKPGGRTGFPSTYELLQRVREILCERDNYICPALAIYLDRFSPTGDKPSNKLHAKWDHINVEELYASIEFESRITEDLMLGSGRPESSTLFYEEFFSPAYQEVVAKLLDGPYRKWMDLCYSASYGSRHFPYLHENFLRIVKMELLDSVSYTLRSLSETEDTSNISRLVHYFNENDSIITFNYDLLLEMSLVKERPSDWSYRTGYGLFSTSSVNLEFDGSASDQPSKFKVLKPHGSCNWHFRFEQGAGGDFPSSVAPPGYRIVPEPFGVGNALRNLQPTSFLATDHYRKAVGEGAATVFFERFMIPPSTYKAEYSFSGEFLHPLTNPLPYRSPTLWLPQLIYRLALHALKAADKIVFIGFSMSPADTSIRMLFRAASETNPCLELLEIADPDPRNEVVNRIMEVIPNARNYKRSKSIDELLEDWDRHSPKATILV